jgi:putative nucleotidyltransferase with HDIG domain
VIPLLPPEAPAFVVRWDELDALHPWIANLRGCPQDPIHHAEGDVWLHTRMVAEAMTASPRWRALPDARRDTLFAAALLHDVAKPATTREEDGRVRAPGHSPRGALMTRRILWELCIDPAAREHVAALVLFHQVPYHFLEDAETKLIRLTQIARADDLALLADADIRGRVCADRQQLLDNVALFGDYAQELDCSDKPWSFPSDHSRVSWFRHAHRDPRWHAYDDTRLDVTVMSGLPGSGKTSWLDAHGPDVPRISLDAIRTELRIPPSDSQGAVIAAGRERARELLRAGQDFAWDATNLTRTLRRGLLDLFASYGARIHVVHVECDAPTLRKRNRKRTAPVPDAVIDKLLDRWQVPDRTEAHRVTHIANGNPVDFATR